MIRIHNFLVSGIQMDVPFKYFDTMVRFNMYSGDLNTKLVQMVQSYWIVECSVFQSLLNKVLKVCH